MACVNTAHASHVHQNSDAVVVQWFELNQRLHLRHGPIDIIAQADGELHERIAAFNQLHKAFESLLVELSEHVTWLRQPISTLIECPIPNTVVNRMYDAVKPFASEFITPMAAVAGSVADYLLCKMCAQRSLSRASINNGGDIALHLDHNMQYRIGVCEAALHRAPIAKIAINANDSVRGVATSGWQGRSYSLGIADAVTVIANNAAQADAAATMIANHVNCSAVSADQIKRLPASELDPQSDLGHRQVTVHVAQLSCQQKKEALDAGVSYANRLVANRIIDAAWLVVQKEYRATSKTYLEGTA